MSERWLPQTPRDELVLEAMTAVRAFSDAMDRMHSGIRGDMDMNATDLAAMRLMVVREQRGEWVSPHQIASHLSISTASTTKLLDRLTASGHLERRPHPHDRRAVVVVATEHAHCEVRERLTNMHDVMAQIAAAVPPESRGDVAQFLTALAAHLDDVEGPTTLGTV